MIGQIGPHLWKVGLGFGVIVLLAMTWALASNWGKAVEATMQYEVRVSECVQECEDLGQKLKALSSSWDCVCGETEGG